MDVQQTAQTVNNAAYLVKAIVGVGAFLLIFIVWYVRTNNKLIVLKNKVDEALSNIDVACQKRAQSVKSCYAAAATVLSTEQKVLLESCKYRSGMNSKEIAQLDSNLTKSMGVINAVAENYPQIQSSEQFLNLQKVITETEETLFAQRRIYNSNVTVFNSAIRMIPMNIVAGMQHCEPYEFLKAEEEEKKPFEIPMPNIDLG